MSELKESIKRGSKVEKELYLIRYSGRDYLTKSNVYFFVDEEDNLYRWNSFTRYPSTWYVLNLNKIWKNRNEPLKLKVSGTCVNVENWGEKRFFGKYDKVIQLTRCKVSHVEETIVENIDILIENFKQVLKHQKMSEETLKLFHKKIEETKTFKDINYFWGCVSLYQQLSEEFIMENIDILNLKCLNIKHLPKKVKSKIKMIRELRA